MRSAPFSVTGTAWGADFNPVSDLLRIVTDTDQIFRLDPNNGTVAGNDSALPFVSGDLNFGRNPNVLFDSSCWSTRYGFCALHH